MITEVPEVTEAPATLVGPAVRLPQPEPITLETKAQTARDAWLAAAKERSKFAAEQDRHRRMLEDRLITAQKNGDAVLWQRTAEGLAYLDDPKNTWFDEYAKKVKEANRLRAEAVELMDRFADRLCKLTTALSEHLKKTALSRLMKMTGQNAIMASNMLTIADPDNSARQLHATVVSHRNFEPLERRLEMLQAVRDEIISACLETECQLPEDE